MKVAFIIPSLENKGPIIFTNNLIKYLISKNVLVDIYYFKTKKSCLLFNTNCYKINLFHKIDFSTYDIIQSTQFLPDLYVFLNRRKIHNKTIISIHNFIDQDLSLLYSKYKSFFLITIWKRILFSNFRYIVSSNYMKEYYIENFNLQSRQIFNIPYGIFYNNYTEINSSDIKLINDIKKKHILIGSVGNLIYRKGFDQLIYFLISNPKYAIIIIGNGDYYDNLFYQVNKHGLNDRFFILGFRNNAYNYYKYFDIYAHTSFSEGFGLALIEALSHGIPIVCSNLPIYTEYFKSQEVSFFIPNDIPSLSFAIHKITASPFYYAKQSYKLFKDNFTINKMGDSHINLYNIIINENQLR